MKTNGWLSYCVLAGVLLSVIGRVSAYGPAALEDIKSAKKCPGCDLTDADLGEAQLSRADLSGADLRQAGCRMRC